MSKKLISLLLVAMLTISMVVIAAVSVSAETSDPQVSISTSDDKSADAVGSGAYLTVNATSNFMGTSSAQYNAETNEVVVTYYMSADKKVENVQYVITYDENVFEKPNGYDDELDWYSDYNSELFGYDGVINLDTESYVRFNTSTVTSGFAANDGTIFAQYTFRVKDISAIAPVTTTINLEVESMLIADYKARKVVPGTEEHLVYKSEADQDIIANRNIKTSTTLTESNYVPVEETTASVVETTEAPEETTNVVETTTTVEETTGVVEETTTEVFETIDGNYMILSADSNVSEIESIYCVGTGNTAVIEYYVNPNKDVLATQWTLSYDPEILELISVDMPQMTTNVDYNKSVAGTVQGNASDLNLYAIDPSKPFVTALVKVIADPTNSDTSTIVNLNIDVLLTADKNEDGSINEASEEYVINNGVVSEEGLLSTDTFIEFYRDEDPTNPTDSTNPTDPPVSDPVSDSVYTITMIGELSETEEEVIEEVTLTSSTADAVFTDVAPGTYMFIYMEINDDELVNIVSSELYIVAETTTITANYDSVEDVLNVIGDGIEFIDSDVAYYVIEFWGEDDIDEPIFSQEFASLDETVEVTLPAGEYLVTVSGYNKDGVEVEFTALSDLSLTAESRVTVSYDTEIEDLVFDVEEITASQPVDPTQNDTTPAPTTPDVTTADATSATGTTGVSGTTASQSTADTATNNNANNNNAGAVQTGEASMAVIILTILVAATGAMFFLNKKNMI